MGYVLVKQQGLNFVFRNSRMNYLEFFKRTRKDFKKDEWEIVNEDMLQQSHQKPQSITTTAKKGDGR